MSGGRKLEIRESEIVAGRGYRFAVSYFLSLEILTETGYGIVTQARYEKGRHRATSRKPKQKLLKSGSPARARTTDQVIKRTRENLFPD